MANWAVLSWLELELNSSANRAVVSWLELETTPAVAATSHLFVNDAGVWKSATTWVNHAGTWKRPAHIFVNDAGTWKEVA